MKTQYLMPSLSQTRIQKTNALSTLFSKLTELINLVLKRIFHVNVVDTTSISGKKRKIPIRINVN